MAIFRDHGFGQAAVVGRVAAAGGAPKLVLR
jgi:hypothetical protein